MTQRQRIALQADWWPAAARAQGWKINDRAMRLRVCMWAVSLTNPTQLDLLEAINSDRTPSRWLESTSDLDNSADVDRVKACLGMLADEMKETSEVGRPEIGRARRLRDVIRDHIKCLGLYVPRPRSYVAEIIDDKFNSWRKYGPRLTIKDLTADPIIKKDGKEIPSQLDQLIFRVSAVVNQKRKQNVLVEAYRHLQGTEPLTIHEMKTTAGVRCDCSFCRRRPQPAFTLPTLAECWGDFDPELEPASASDPELGAAISEDSGENPF